MDQERKPRSALPSWARPLRVLYPAGSPPGHASRRCFSARRRTIRFIQGMALPVGTDGGARLGEQRGAEGDGDGADGVAIADGGEADQVIEPV